MSKMCPTAWIPADCRSLLDVGCNVGAFLKGCADRWPSMSLAGVDINSESLVQARACVPWADIRQITGATLPFKSAAFDCVTCIEVIEHIPAGQRQAAIREMARVLKPGGRLIIRTPHAGWFAWLDAQNFRFRLPRLYRLAVGGSSRDLMYAAAEQELVWHHHFTRTELLSLAEPTGITLFAEQYGGLFVFPLMDILRWPLYRTGKGSGRLSSALERIAGWDDSINFGPRASYGILLVFEKSN